MKFHRFISLSTTTILAVSLLPFGYAAMSDDSEDMSDNDLELKLRVGLSRGKWDGEYARDRPEESSPIELSVRQQHQERQDSPLVGDQFNYFNIQPPDNHQQRRPYYPLPPPPPPLPPPYWRPYEDPYYYPNYNVPPRQYAPPSSSSTSTTPKPPGPITPMGYLLMDTYQSRRGSITKPVAFFTT